MNGDGRQDLAVVNTDPGTVSVLLGLGDGTLATRLDSPTLHSRALIAADLNGDGKLDLATVQGQIQVLLGLGDGSFTALEAQGSGQFTSAAIGDFDGNGKLDLGLGDYGGRGWSGSVTAMPGLGDGTFAVEEQMEAVSGETYVVVAGDLNQDSKSDLAACRNGVSVLLAQEEGKLALACEYTFPCDSLALGDLNNDSKLDLATADQLTNQVSVLLGNGDGTFGHGENGNGTPIR
jgi:hypothetical protein